MGTTKVHWQEVHEIISCIPWESMKNTFYKDMSVTICSVVYNLDCSSAGINSHEYGSSWWTHSRHRNIHSGPRKSAADCQTFGKWTSEVDEWLLSQCESSAQASTSFASRFEHWNCLDRRWAHPRKWARDQLQVPCQCWVASFLHRKYLE